MSSINLKEKGMYNEKIKMQFLEEQYPNEASRDVLAYLFYRSRITEEELGKDLFDFSIDDLTQLLKNLSPRNDSVAKSNGSVINTYLNWAIENKLRKVVDNPLHGIDTSFYEGFVGESRLFISKNELDAILEGIVNAQDAVILQLLFDGVSGTGMTEILNLKPSDINWETNVLSVEDDKYGKREVKVSENCLRLLRQAINEKMYIAKNGTVEGKKSEAELVDTEYVLRTVKLGAYEHGRAKSSLIYRRMDMIQEFVDTGLESFTTKAITKSGMIHEGYKIFLEENQLTGKQLGKVAEKFGVRKVKIGEHEYYNTNVLGKFINRENILELYGVDIEKETN